MHLAQRAAHHSRILRRSENLPAIDQAKAGDDAIAITRGAAVQVLLVARQDQRIDLVERAGVEEQVQALTGRQATLAVLRLYLFRGSGSDSFTFTELGNVGLQENLLGEMVSPRRQRASGQSRHPAATRR